MSLDIRDLEYLRVGWQKVVDCGKYGNTIYVFRVGDRLSAVTNRSQGVGDLLEEIHAAKPATPPGKDAMPVKGAPADYSVLYDGVNPFKPEP
jgi:hypothetical protein